MPIGNCLVETFDSKVHASIFIVPITDLWRWNQKTILDFKPMLPILWWLCCCSNDESKNKPKNRISCGVLNVCLIRGSETMHTWNKRTKCIHKPMANNWALSFYHSLSTEENHCVNFFCSMFSNFVKFMLWYVFMSLRTTICVCMLFSTIF